MGFMDLRQWIGMLEKEGELQRIRAEVDWDREIGALARRVLEKKGPALLFESIKGYRDGLITEQTALAYASQRSIVRRGIDEFNYAIGAAKDELGVKLAIDQEYEQRLYDERQKVGSR